MRPKERWDSGQNDFFKARFDQIVDSDHALAKLGRAIDWRFLEGRFGAAYAGRDDRRFQELCHEPLRRASVPATLDQDVENETILIDGAPKPVLFARDRDDDLIHMPFVAASRRALADLIGECLAELLPPLAHGLVGHANPTRRQHLFDHAQAQGKPEIEPNRMADDFRRKTMALVERVAGCRHGGPIAARPRFNR